MADIDLHFECADPAALRAWLTSLGWTGQPGEKAAGADRRVREFGPFREELVAGRQVAFVYIVATAPLDPPAGIVPSRIALAAVGAGVAGPAPVSLSQLLFALRGAGFISQSEALAAAKTGDIPASLQAALWAAVPNQATRDDIELLWAAMYQADRENPFWQFVVQAGIATAEQMDQVFAMARTL